jgi:hypothetical protein
MIACDVRKNSYGTMSSIGPDVYLCTVVLRGARRKVD